MTTCSFAREVHLVLAAGVAVLVAALNHPPERITPQAPTNRFMALSTGGAANDYDRNRSMGRGSSMGCSQSRGDSRSRLGGSQHSLGGRRGKNISRHSQKQDHEAALSAAR